MSNTISKRIYMRRPRHVFMEYDPQEFGCFCLFDLYFLELQLEIGLKAGPRPEGSGCGRGLPGRSRHGVCHDKPPPHASRSAGNKGKHSGAWKPLFLPIPALEDFAVVVKPKTLVSLSEAFQEHELGQSSIAYLGPASAQVITVLPVREQNIILVYTSKPEIADRIIGAFDLNSADGHLPLTGHLRQDSGNV
ncbi:hypothetical protein HPB49_015463 [Dermacentor silvarum]|uniref:Uncharacterized protein n=1 Tax=Dermacentor silvarum TaxID=543639 RepID=A0ACB8CFV4_DERSI|nr:hypothetical protein HPB49_015463 [Dermacentor silvarum]